MTSFLLAYPRLPVLQGTAAEMAAYTSMLEGDLWYQTDVKKWYSYDGTSWNAIANADTGDGHIDINLIAYNSIGAGTWAFTNTTTHYNNGSFGNGATHSNGDNVTYNVYLTAGTYSLRMIAKKLSGGGICKVYLNAENIAIFDTYNSGDLDNQIFSQTGIAITANGIYSLKLNLEGKNASSSNYYLFANGLALWRTA